MGKFDWSALFTGVAALFTGVAVVISIVALALQRKDLNKQAKYQRDTFDLQNMLEEYKLIIDLASGMIASVMELAHLKESIYKQVIDEKIRWKTRVEAMGMGNAVYEEMTSLLHSKSQERLTRLKQLEREQFVILEKNTCKLAIHKIVLKEENKAKSDELFVKITEELERMQCFIETADNAKIEDLNEKEVDNWAISFMENIQNYTLEFNKVFISIKEESLVKLNSLKATETKCKKYKTKLMNFFKKDSKSTYDPS